jgi:AcrR family transcriptional regulator
LDEGGPDAVTLRAVGSKAGVSRGAPYGHFADKENLLTALAVRGWAQLAADLTRLRADEFSSSQKRLNQAIVTFLAVARERPHLYALMFATPTRDPQTLINAAAAAQDAFLAIVADVVGVENARRTGALLMSTAHGIAGMEHSGQLSEAKWDTTGDRILEQLITLLGGAR